jgi:hypothetical protein
MDSSTGVAYFGTEASAKSASAIVQVNVRNLHRTGALTPDQGIAAFTASVIDVPHGFAYFGASRSVESLADSRIVKVRLSDFSVVGEIAVNESYPVSAVLDAASGFAYFGGWIRSITGRSGIVKVRLSNLTVEGILTLNLGEEELTSAVIDTVNGFAYFGTCTTPAMVVKIRLLDFVRVGSLTLNPDESCLGSAVIDPLAGFAYFGTYFGGSSKVSFPGKVIKIRLSDLTRVGALELPKADLGTAVIDSNAGFAYFGSGSNYPGTIFAIRLSDFTLINATILGNGESLEYAHGSAVIDETIKLAWFAVSNTLAEPAIIVEVKLLPAAANGLNPRIPGSPLESMVVGMLFGLVLVTILRTRIRLRRSYESRHYGICAPLLTTGRYDGSDSQCPGTSRQPQILISPN